MCRGIVVWDSRKVYHRLMDDFRIDPPLVVKDQPRPRRLRSLAEARALVAEAMKVGRPEPWREVYHRLTTVGSDETLTRRSATCASYSKFAGRPEPAAEFRRRGVLNSQPQRARRHPEQIAA